jgi:pimeloyl-ACP methyl ester carboxylesterase
MFTLGRHSRSSFAIAFALGLTSLAAAQPPAPGPEGDARFQVFLRGQVVGNEDVGVARVDGGWRIVSTGRLAAPLDVTLRRAEIRYNADWTPVSLSIDAAVRGQTVDVSTAFAGTTATSRFPQAGEMAEKTDTVARDTIVLPNNIFGAYAALAVRLTAASPGAELKIYVAPQAEVTVVLNALETHRVQTAERTFNARQYRLTIRNPGGGLDVEVWADDATRLLRVTIPAVELDVVREDLASAFARVQKFHREGDEDVRIPSTGFSLAASVSRPRPLPPPRSPKQPARLPTIVLVPGSGPVDRDETVGGIPIFGELASALADAGFLVVRYDKRGVGQSGGRPESATLSDYAEDVRAVVRWARKRKDVDEKRLFVVGHSEGAWAALLAASREKRIARVVSIAGPGTTGAELVLEQQRHALERMTFSDAERTEKIALQKKIMSAVTTGQGWEGVPDELRRQAESPWFASFLTFDPAKTMRRVRQPLLVLQAELDRQVPAHHAARLVELARARKKNAGVEIVTLEGVNHLLVPATTGEVEEYGSLTGRHVTPKAAGAIAAWLGK